MWSAWYCIFTESHTHGGNYNNDYNLEYSYKYNYGEPLQLNIMAPKSQSRWDMPNKTLGMSASEYVRDNCARLLDRELAQDLNAAGFDTNRAAVEKKRERLGIGKMWVHGNTYAPYDGFSPIAESSFAKYDSPPVINADRVAIFPDLQFPYANHEFTNKVLDLCRQWEVKHCILAGDVIECSSLTHFDPAWDGSANSEGISDDVADDLIDAIANMPKKVADEVRKVIEKHGRKTLASATSVSEEWGYAKKHLAQLIKQFDNVVWIVGNHEGRILRQMQSPVLPLDLKKMFVGDEPKISIAPYYYALVNSNGEAWRIIHPKSAGRDDPQVYASKLLCHVVMAHSHHWNLGKDRSGKFFAISTGAMVDERRLAYSSQRDNKSFQHLLGATIIRGGKPWLLGEDSQWELLKKL